MLTVVIVAIPVMALALIIYKFEEAFAPRRIDLIDQPYIRLAILWILGDREEVSRLASKIKAINRANSSGYVIDDSIFNRDIEAMLEEEVSLLERKGAPPQLYPDQNNKTEIEAAREWDWMPSRKKSIGTPRPNTKPAPRPGKGLSGDYIKRYEDFKKEYAKHYADKSYVSYSELKWK